MTPAEQVVLSGALTFGVPLLLAIRELILLRRPRRDGGPPPGDPIPPAPKPLPDCLIPKPFGLGLNTQPHRELEDA